MPLEKVGDLPRPRRNSSNSSEDLVPMLEQLEVSPGEWFKVDEIGRPRTDAQAAVPDHSGAKEEPRRGVRVHRPGRRLVRTV